VTKGVNVDSRFDYRDRDFEGAFCFRKGTAKRAGGINLTSYIRRKLNSPSSIATYLLERCPRVGH
jgi:hypothetical protein